MSKLDFNDECLAWRHRKSLMAITAKVNEVAVIVKSRSRPTDSDWSPDQPLISPNVHHMASQAPFCLEPHALDRFKSLSKPLKHCPMPDCYGACKILLKRPLSETNVFRPRPPAQMLFGTKGRKGGEDNSTQKAFVKKEASAKRKKKKLELPGCAEKIKRKKRSGRSIILCFVSSAYGRRRRRRKKVFLPFNDESRLPVRWQEGEKKTRQIIHSRSSYQY